MNQLVLSLRRALPLPAFFLALLSSVLCVPCSAAEAKKSFDLPAGAAAETLKQFAVQAGREIVFAPEAVNGAQTKALKGELTPKDALDQLLADTGLVASLDAKTGAFAVRRSESPNAFRAAQTDSDRPQSSIKVEEGVVKMDTFEVMSSKLLNMDIRRSRDDAQPYVTFDRATLARSGAISIEDFLRTRLTMNSQNSSLSDTGNINTTSGNINLRGLGTNQTLILIDGRRAPDSATPTGLLAQPELTGIPLAAVERIEVLPTTASGIYGGSATGGVINVILRRDYAGTEIKATYENSFETDSAIRRVDISTGFSLEGGKTNILLTLGYTDSNALLAQDRGFLADYRQRILANNGGNFDALLNGTTPPLGATPNIRSSTGVNLTLKNGTPLNSPRTFVPVGYRGILTDAGGALVANAGRFNLDWGGSNRSGTAGAGAGGIFQRPETVSASLTARRQFAPWLEAYLDAGYSESRIWFPTGNGDATLSLAATSPANPFQQPVVVRLPLLDAGSVFFNQSQKATLAAGLVARLPAKWMSNLDFSYGRTRSTYREHAGLPAAFTTAAQSGSIDVLRDTLAYPVDMAAYGGSFEGRTLVPARTVTKNAALRASGPTVRLPAGAVGLSGMVEVRDAGISAGSRAASASFPFFLAPDRSRRVYSGYLEAKIPLFGAEQRMRLGESLELQLAVRHDDYTTEGASSVSSTGPVPRATNRVSSTDPTIALRWTPVRDVSLRASYGTGFLPPDTSQLTGSTAVAAQTVIDPRRGNTSISVPGPQIQINGSPDLKPEQSETWSAGLIVTPRILPGLRISADYTRIEKSDNITNLFTAQPIVDNEAFLAGRVTRGANLPGDQPGWAGPILAVDARILNLSAAELEAVDFQADYSFRASAWGDFDLFASATRTLHYKTQLTPIAAVIENVGTNPAIGAPLPWKASGSVTWRKGAWAAGWAARYVDSYWVYLSSANAATAAINRTNQGNGGRVADQVYHDVWASYRFGSGGYDGHRWVAPLLSGLEITAGIKNVFNRAPAFDARGPQSSTNYSQQGDPRLAVYYVSLKKSF